MSGCWIYDGPKTKDGYGISGGKKAHRRSYELYVGPIPAGLCVCHKCDNPPCVNPKHLFVATQKENNQDRARKGRNADRRGEKSPVAKLTWEKVREIRRLFPQLTQKELSDIFGVSQLAIACVGYNRTWYDPNYTPTKRKR